MKRKKLTILLCVIALIAAALAVWIAITNGTIDISRYEIKNNKLPESFDGYKIVQVSDLHNRKGTDKLIDLIEAENPNIIAVTGDIVSAYNYDLEAALDFAEKATDIAPVYYVTGNHEFGTYKYDEIKQKLKDAGFVVLDNKSVYLFCGDEKINLCGIDDPNFYKKYRSERPDYENVFIETLPTLMKENEFNLLLSHRPEYFELYAELGYDLILTGHAHGGQIRLPFIGGLYAPNQGLFPEYTEGVHEKSNTQMVVSRGVGDSIIPLRVNNSPELVAVTLAK